MAHVFSDQKSKQFGQILECLAMEAVSLIYGHLVYFTDILYILFGNSVYFSRVGILYQYKSGNPARANDNSTKVTKMLFFRFESLARFRNHKNCTKKFILMSENNT
jgi:hypothetical protein